MFGDATYTGGGNSAKGTYNFELVIESFNNFLSVGIAPKNIRNISSNMCV